MSGQRCVGVRLTDFSTTCGEAGGGFEDGFVAWQLAAIDAARTRSTEPRRDPCTTLLSPSNELARVIAMAPRVVREQGRTDPPPPRPHRRRDPPPSVPHPPRTGGGRPRQAVLPTHST